MSSVHTLLKCSGALAEQEDGHGLQTIHQRVSWAVRIISESLEGKNLREWR